MQRVNVELMGLRRRGRAREREREREGVGEEKKKKDRACSILSLLRMLFEGTVTVCLSDS